MHIKPTRHAWQSEDDRNVLLPYYTYRLIESYRDENGETQKRPVMYLGELPSCADLKYRRHLASALTSLQKGEPFEMFIPQEIIDEAYRLYEEWLASKQVEEAASQAKKASLAAERAKRVEQAREVRADLKLRSKNAEKVRSERAEHVCHEVTKKLGIRDVLVRSMGWEERYADIAVMQIIARAVAPGSELATSKYFLRESSLNEMFNFADGEITKDDLYESALRLYACTDATRRWGTTSTRGYPSCSASRTPSSSST
ncbi:MAG: hypothetical protein IJ202_08215 [Bacteroidales bacterium]|nr:hypothetical protein [Bacteroidales bacterium]